MDVFSSIAAAIDLTERVFKAIDDFKKIPERMRRIQFDVKSLQETMWKLKEMQYRSKEHEKMIVVEVEEIEKLLKDLQNKINRQKQKASSSVLSRSFRTFKTQLKFEDMDELADELQKRKSNLGLCVNMLVLKSVENVELQIQEQHQQNVSMAAAAVDAETGAQRQAKTTAKEITHISKKEFLDHLNAPNYAEDELRVKSPVAGTAMWIYERDEFKKWEQEKSASLHLVGKMGSGKSVLTKSILGALKSKQAATPGQISAVLYYFCSCVDRTDNAANILKGFISQFTLEHDHIYEKTALTNELLQSRRSGDNTGWSFEALWHIFFKMVQCSGLTSLCCVVDALDECDSKSLDEFLDLLHKLSKDNLIPNMNIKLLFSSREYTHIIDSLDANGSSLRLFVDPDSVSSDIRLAMQNDIKGIQRRLKLEDDEAGTLQESILKKSDGMFLWVSLAAKNIMDNAYDATFETLEELIEDLPSGLKGLYEKNWVKLIESLPNAKLELANKVLTWVLLADRSLTISELTLALAVERGQKNIPPPKKLLRNLSAFILNYLAPFIEIISSVPESETPETQNKIGEEELPVYKSIDNSKIRLVHQSAQEYLLEACKTSNSRLEINLREGHEAIARTCLTYLCAEELQLGWIDEMENEYGLLTTTDETRTKVETRLNEFPLLGYASVNWSIHVRKCQFHPRNKAEKEEDDIFSQAINFAENFQRGYACAAQARQLLNNWDADAHYAPAPCLHGFAGKDMLVIVKRLLRTPGKYVSTRDRENCTALHYAAQGYESEEHPEDREEIIQILLNAGVDPDAVNSLGDTPLRDAASLPLPGVVNILLKWGVEVNTKNKKGVSALNGMNALGSKEITEALLDAGADIESADLKGFTPILTAAQSDLPDTIRTLIARGSNVNAQCDLGWACIHYAVQKGRNDIVSLLTENGADVNIKTESGIAPLHSAVRFDNVDAVHLLLKHGADIQVKDNFGRSLLHSAAENASLDLFKFILEGVPDVNAKELNDWTSLAFAAERDHLEITRLLVSKGADIMALETAGFTPLHVAIESGSLNVAKFYLETWGDIEMQTSKALTPLGLACSAGEVKTDVEMINLLIEKGADPNMCADRLGMNPLHIASCEGVDIAVEALLKHGADIEGKAIMGIRPFTFACKEGRLETAKLLFSKGALLEGFSTDEPTDFTALELTCFNGYLDVVQFLLDNGADASRVSFAPIIRNNRMVSEHKDVFRLMMKNGMDVDKTDKIGNSDTPLLAAMNIANHEFAQLILEYNPDLTKHDSGGGWTAFHLAALDDHVEFLEILTKKSSPAVFSSILDGLGSYTPGQVAAINGSLDSLKLLTNLCPKESFRISNINDFFEILRLRDPTPTLDFLKDFGALDINFSDMTAKYTGSYHYSGWIIDGSDDMFDHLDELGMNWNIKDVAGRTVLLSLMDSLMESLEASRAEKLLKLGGRIDIRDINLMTAFDLLVCRALGKVPLIPLHLPPAPRTKVPKPRLSQGEPSAILQSSQISAPPLYIPPVPLPKVPKHPSQGEPQTALPSSQRPSPLPPTPLLTSPPIGPNEGLLEKAARAASLRDSLSGSEFPSPISDTEDSWRVAAAKVAARALILSPTTGEILVDDMGASILHAAARAGVHEIVEAVLDVNEEIADVRDLNGWTAAMVARVSHWEDLAQKLEAFEKNIGDLAERKTMKPERLRVFDAGIRTNALSVEGQLDLNPIAASVMANAPVPFEAQEFYYEVEFLEDLDENGLVEPFGSNNMKFRLSGCATIGFCVLPRPLKGHLPGWNQSGIYKTSTTWRHSSSGRIHPDLMPDSDPYGEEWKAGDVLGCGWEKEGGKVWFVRNGKFLGTAFTQVSGQLYPTVGLEWGAFKLRVNFDAKPPVHRVEPIRSTTYVNEVPSVFSPPIGGGVVRDEEALEANDANSEPRT